jgi:hypothetical protein
MRALEDEDQPSVKASRNADHFDCSRNTGSKKRWTSGGDFNRQAQVETQKPDPDQRELDAALALASCKAPAQ